MKNQGIAVPVMVLIDEADKDRPNKLLECVPIAKQVIVPDTGQVSILENPEAFTNSFRNSLTRDKRFGYIDLGVKHNFIL